MPSNPIVQIRVWFEDGAYYDLRGRLDAMKMDRELGKAETFGDHKIVPVKSVSWHLDATLEPWEFGPDGKPQHPLLLGKPRLAGLPAPSGQGKSIRARKRARARAARARGARTGVEA
jgi:hypothetical protein